MAMDEDPELATDRNASLTFVIASFGDTTTAADLWRVFLLGAFFIVHFGEFGVEEVLAPQSAYREALASGLPREVARDLAGVSTLAAAPGQPCEGSIQVADVRLKHGETLLALPEPRGLIDINQPIRSPRSIVEVRNIAETLRRDGGHLRGDQGMWSRSMLAILGG